MPLQDLAKILSDRGRIGLNDDLATRLKVRAEDATRGQLLAEEEGDQGHLGVYLMSAYVVDDTDVWGDGEIYWWAIPTLSDASQKTRWSPLSGLPTGAPPHKCGSLEWMTNFSIHEPPLLAVIPPGEDVSACTIRLAFYDDDAEVANVPAAIQAGLEVLAGMTVETVASPEQIISPVREAIFKSLKAEDDDILLDQDVTLRRGNATRFGAGFIGSVMNSMVRVYYFVRDEARTEQAGPFVLHKGQIETVRFKTPLEPGGKIALFSRGADVTAAAFGTMDTDTPFLNRSLDSNAAKTLAQGFNLSGSGAAKVIAFYTPP